MAKAFISESPSCSPSPKSFDNPTNINSELHRLFAAKKKEDGKMVGLFLAQSARPYYFLSPYFSFFLHSFLFSPFFSSPLPPFF
jgi:hypothetical protein